MANRYLLRKPTEAFAADLQGRGGSLRRALGPIDLVLLGIGCIIGTGIFVLTGVAAVNHAGPAVIASYAVAGVACTLAAICYSEFATMLPISGSAYSYAYATLGELVAWIIGWDLILEYAVGNIAVAISWAAYFRQLMLGFGIEIPAWIATDYRSASIAAKSVADAIAGGADAAAAAAGLSPEMSIAYQAQLHAPTVLGLPVIFNLPAAAITAFITWILVIGIKESARFNNVVVVLKVVTLLFFIAVGAFHVNQANWHPFFPGGLRGVWTGASLIFFAYIGFDAISTAAEECEDAGRDMPRGIIGSLLICTVLYIAAALVLTGMIPYAKLAGAADPLAVALSYVNQGWAAGLLAFGAVVAMTAVLLVFQLGQPRILMAMSRDGLLSPWFAKIHPKYRTPYVTTILTGIFVGFFSAIANIDEIVQLTNIGTLFAFVLVCVGILILRKREPERPRKFRVPFVPWTPLLGIVTCVLLMAGLPRLTWIRFILWLAAGMVLYFVYGMRRSRLAAKG
jgi:APA family basic amino acid/polyamine antiporter